MLPLPSAPKETICIGSLELHFLLDGDDTNQQLCLFEFMIPTNARMPAPHYHAHVDEVLYGLSGTLHGIVDGKPVTLGPGQTLFIPRGAVHYYSNPNPEPGRVLVTLTPASIGPAYFRDMAALLAAGGPPDPAQVQATMARHGLVVA